MCHGCPPGSTHLILHAKVLAGEEITTTTGVTLSAADAIEALSRSLPDSAAYKAGLPLRRRQPGAVHCRDRRIRTAEPDLPRIVERAADDRNGVKGDRKQIDARNGRKPTAEHERASWAASVSRGRTPSARRAAPWDRTG